MTDARREWISKRAYAIWEETGRPHGHDGEHWAQAVREREEFERLAPEARTATAKKPLIEISAKAKKTETAKPKKKADSTAEKPASARQAKAKALKTAANSKPI